MEKKYESTSAHKHVCLMGHTYVHAPVYIHVWDRVNVTVCWVCTRVQGEGVTASKHNRWYMIEPRVCTHRCECHIYVYESVWVKGACVCV